MSPTLVMDTALQNFELKQLDLSQMTRAEETETIPATGIDAERLKRKYPVTEFIKCPRCNRDRFSTFLLNQFYMRQRNGQKSPIYECTKCKTPVDFLEGE